MKIFDEKYKRNKIVFKEYELNGATSCPECGRPFKEYDIKRLLEVGKISCSKCNARLVK